MDIGICQLCRKQKELIRKSHIIPKPFHHYTTQELKKHFDATDSAYIYSQNGREQQVQMGLYVGGILCKDCDNFIGKWDNYAQKLLLKKIDVDVIAKKQGLTREIQTINDINYKSLKLFFLSLLWRSHLARNATSKVAQFFKEVNLGEQWELKLRAMISNENPGKEDDFSVVLIKHIGKESCIHALPTKRIEGNLPSFYHFTFGGYSFYIKVDQREFPDEIRKIILKPDAPLYFPVKHYKDSPDYLYLLEWANSVPEK